MNLLAADGTSLGGAVGNVGANGGSVHFVMMLPENPTYMIPNTPTLDGMLSTVKLHTSGPVTCTNVTVSLEPRPGYNEVGLSIAQAVTVSNGTVVHLSMRGQTEVVYNRLILKPGGQLTLSGSITNVSNGSAGLSGQILNADLSSAGTMVNVGAGAHVTKTFTSLFTLTNTSAVSKLYYIKWTHNGNYVYSSDITVQAGTALLTVFLNAHDPSSTLASIRANDDVSHYIPGANIADGTSLALPTATQPIQSVQLVAAYLDEQGNLVAPPTGSVTFSLEDTPGHSTSSAFQGVAMNWSDPRGDGLPDFVLEANSAGFSADNTARVLLDCWDYGGYVAVTASHDSAAAPPLQLPQGVTGASLLPEVGWYANGQHVDQAGLSAGDDADPAPSVSPPPTDGLLGDGLTLLCHLRGREMGAAALY